MSYKNTGKYYAGKYAKKHNSDRDYFLEVFYKSWAYDQAKQSLSLFEEKIYAQMDQEKLKQISHAYALEIVDLIAKTANPASVWGDKENRIIV